VSLRACTVAVLVATATAPAAASTVELLPADRLYAEAERIVDGTVSAAITRWNATGTGLETVATVTVEATWRGPLAATVEVVAPGGTLDGARHVIVGSPTLGLGERARWFLRDRGDGRLGVYGWAQGKWPARTIAGATYFAPDPRAAEQPFHLHRFKLNGMVWPAAKMPVPYVINQDGSADLAMDDVIAAVDAAFATWQAVPCATLTFVNAGATGLGVAVDGTNVVTFIESGWVYGAEAAAATSLWIVDGQQTADIAINGERFRWSIGPPNAEWATTLDLQAVLTHEIGHFSGLGHTVSAFDTMYYTWKPWQGQRTLSIDDKLALCALYPTFGDECPGVACGDGEACVAHPQGQLCTGTPDPIGAPCSYERVECSGFCLFTAADLSAGYCSQFCASDRDCPLTHHCDAASAGAMTVKVCYAGAPPDPPGTCSDDSQCDAGQHCDALHNACTFECRADLDCGPGATCDANGVCRDRILSGGGCRSAGSSPELPLLAVLVIVARRRRRAMRVEGRRRATAVRRAAIAAALVSLAGCADQGLVVCGNGWACPLGFACDLAHRGCVLPEQLEVCADRPDGTPCSFTGAPFGTCIDGVCFAAECGNGVVDPNEACDDGNRINGDGCSGDCLEIERCGNGAIETGLGEACDDGNLVNHDGCNSACALEQADWRARAPSPIGYRRFAAIVHDPFRERTVVFGGFDANITSETIEWDGAVWRARFTVSGPAARLNPSAAFDATRGELVLFGGLVNGSTHGGDTWVYDGVGWTRRLPQTSPTVRTGATLAYDVRRRRAVLFGGHGGPTTLGDTWEWDGATWTQAAPTQGPGLRNLARSCFDPVSGRVLMIGGIDDFGDPVANQLWSWDGTSWTIRAAATLPVGVPLAMAADPSRGRVVLLTHVSAGTTAEWEWDGTTWTQTAAVLPELDREGTTLFYDHRLGRLGLYALIVSGRQLAMMYRTATGWESVPGPLHPPARDDAAMADDLRRGVAVLFGGRDAASNPLDDLWMWHGSHWVQHQPTGAAPTGRYAHAMAYDLARGEVVVVGGRTTAGRTGETWVFDGAAWRLAGTLPAREDMAIAYDTRRQRVVGFGGIAVGFDGFAHHVAETWEWDGSSWQHVMISGPPGRSRHGMAYDARRARIVVFGGLDDYQTYNDVWEYDGIAWEQRTASPTPPARRDHALVYNATRGTTVLMGGRTSLFEGAEPLGDTWEWDGTAWKPIATFLAPTPRSDHAASFHAPTAHVIAFGGATTDETWSFGYDGPLPSEVCGSGHDVDRDGLAGCDDPDCWWMCAPACAPGASCDVSAPRCGDGTCASLETCRACPADCGPCTHLCGDLVCDPGESCLGDC
jgi:cysteine-rich repeat protein